MSIIRPAGNGVVIDIYVTAWPEGEGIGVQF